VSAPTRQLTLEDGLHERESLRPDRRKNYAIKEAAGWTCMEDGCNKNFGVVVVETRNGPETRCFQHVGRHRIRPGQWTDRSGI
jgi:hypothetical protein